jgi:hypothetical protein
MEGRRNADHPWLKASHFWPRLLLNKGMIHDSIDRVLSNQSAPGVRRNRRAPCAAT